MEELLNLYGGNVHGFSVGEKVKGTVTEITPKRLILDIGGKSEGVVAEKAFKEAERFIKTLKVGDVVEGKVIVPETREGYSIISLRTAAEDAKWDKIEKAYDSDTSLKVEVKNVMSSGVMVDISGLTGFVPRSQLGRDVEAKIEEMVGHKLDVKVLDVDRHSNKIVLSERLVSEAQEIEKQKLAFEKVKEGEVYEGKVTTVYDFGIFVAIPVEVEKDKKISVEGLVHISELSWNKSENVKRDFSVGDKVTVKVVSKKDDKLSFSIKQTKKDPWDEIEEKYTKDSKLTGKVVRTSDFGIFVELEPGVEGLIHMTKIPPGKKFSNGDDINVYIEEVEKEARKVSLGLVLTAKPIGYR